MFNTQKALTVIALSLAVLSAAVAQDGALTPAVVGKLRSEFKADAQALAMRNALTSTDVKQITENRDILASHNEQFSHRIKTKGISNQKASGRCWMFAGLNTIKPVLLNKLELGEFEFSQIYLQFWDKLEKANAFLEYMIEFRDRDLMDRDLVFLLKDPARDDGYWENFVDLVNKYGVVPKEAMAETASSENTGMLNQTLGRLLRKHAITLRQVYKETGSAEKMRQAKPPLLAEVYRVLVLNLGQPPAEFTWRYPLPGKPAADSKSGAESKPAAAGSSQDKPAAVEDQVAQKWSPLRTFTPQAFYREFVGLDLNQYLNLTDDPIRPKGGHYEIDLTRDMWGGRNMHYANVTTQQLREAAVKTLRDNKALYFGADVSPDQDSKRGIMARGLYDYESAYGLKLGLNKTERMLFRDGSVNHGMAFIGVDLQGGKPVKWLVENSWGADRGSKGLWTMDDAWFEDNVYNLLVHRDYVPEEIRKVFDQQPQKLPVWDPLW